jgi:hypothetical protein
VAHTRSCGGGNSCEVRAEKYRGSKERDIAEEKKKTGFFEQSKEKIYLVASSQSSEGAVV